MDNYQLLLDGLQLQCDFTDSCERLKVELDAKLDCCNALLNSVSLRRFAHLMLQVGNILNEVLTAICSLPSCCNNAIDSIQYDMMHLHHIELAVSN